MSTMRLSCPYCGQHYELDAALAGQTVECEKCGKAFEIDTPVEVAEAAPAALPTAKLAAIPPGCEFCSVCGGVRAIDAPACPHCGAVKQQTPQTIPPGLIRCPSCGKAMSPNARSCPHCGVARPQVGFTFAGVVEAGLIFVVLPIAGLIFVLIFLPKPIWGASLGGVFIIWIICMVTRFRVR